MKTTIKSKMTLMISALLTVMTLVACQVKSDTTASTTQTGAE